ncbi:hypothetical protein ACFO26_02200 [Lactococcus nasutitermitis]|uniref:WxL domain-containing protein n=1 Tax=Lactococcus nasutitermitis TaxID=1652957 RepID=A0ABV9JEA9_9LACT|nr:hypothetical protein [Lactococcus nasutitermitis]
MNTKKVFIGTLALSALFVAGAFATSAHAFADDTAPTTQDVAPVIDTSQSGDTTLSVPDSADKVIKDTDNQVEYQVNDAVTVDSSSGPDLTAPVTVDSQITSDDGDTTEGVTSYTTDLSQAQEVDNTNTDNLNLVDIPSVIIGDLFGTKAFAISNNKSDWDSTGGVKFILKISWTSSGGYAVLTGVSGGYTNYDINHGTSVQSSLVNLGTDGQIKGTSGGSQQVDDVKEYSNSSWSITPKYKAVKVPAAGALVGATYHATLTNGKKSWNFSTTNRAY